MPEKNSSTDVALTNRLLAAVLARDLSMPDGAPLLASLGVPTADIALIYGATDSTVRSAISRGRRKGA